MVGLGTCVCAADNCQRRFLTLSGKRKHEKKVHELFNVNKKVTYEKLSDGKIKCQVCLKIFASGSTYSRHKKTCGKPCHSFRPFVCLGGPKMTCALHLQCFTNILWK